MKKIYSLLTLFVFTLAAMAQSVTTVIDFKTNPFGVAGKVTTSPYTHTYENITFTLEKGKGSSINLSSSEWRFYKGNVFKLEVSGTITKVAFTGDSTNAQYSDLTKITQGGTALGADGVWMGSQENMVEFSNTKQVRIAKLEITYTPGAGAVAAPTFSLEKDTFNTPQTLTLMAEAGATIYYTLDGKTPTTASMQYTAPINMEKDDTYMVSAIAVKDGKTSPVAKKTYVIDFPGINEAAYKNSMLGKTALDGFTKETASQDSVFDVWTVTQYGTTANGYVNKKRHAAVATLITPVINLEGVYNIFVSFDESANYFEYEAVNYFAEQAKVKVREEGGEWVDFALTTRANGTANDFVNTGKVSLEAYKGKKIQFGFFYTSTAQHAGRWQIKNFLVSADVTKITGIGNVKKETRNNVIYDLSGRRVNKAERGIYIINGKKTLVK